MLLLVCIARLLLLLLAVGSVLRAQEWHLVHEVRDGLPLDASRTLRLSAVVDAATTAHGGRLAFAATVSGTSPPAERNQGLFLAGGGGVRALAIGSGGLGGSGQPGADGDAAPGGGTFAGFFGGTACAPAMDEGGSVLFLADVRGAARALFLYDAGADAILRVAGVGDAWPTGGAIAAIGPGTFAPGGRVLFLAARAGQLGGDLLGWTNGALDVVAARGDPLPGGGAIDFVATESTTFVDGTSMPFGPLPDATSCGDVVLRVNGAGGAPSSGFLCVHADGTREWLLRAGDAAPGGGVFAAFGAPRLSPTGELAFTADVFLPSGGTAAWFAGRPGAWRRVLGFFDAVDGGQCLGLAMSRGPFRPLDERGDLLLWCDLARTGGQDRIVRCLPSGGVEVLARRGDALATGGVLGELGGWPTSDGPGRAAFGAQLLGSSARTAHLVFATDEPIVRAPACAALGGTLEVSLRGPRGSTFLLAASSRECAIDLPPYGVLRIGPDPLWMLGGLTPQLDSFEDRVVSVAIPSDPALDGLGLCMQALAFGLPDARLGGVARTCLRRRRRSSASMRQAPGRGHRRAIDDLGLPDLPASRRGGEDCRRRAQPGAHARHGRTPRPRRPAANDARRARDVGPAAREGGPDRRGPPAEDQRTRSPRRSAGRETRPARPAVCRVRPTHEQPLRPLPLLRRTR